MTAREAMPLPQAIVEPVTRSGPTGGAAPDDARGAGARAVPDAPPVAPLPARPDARFVTPRRLPLWAVPLAVLALLLALTYALWRAEVSLETHNIEEVVFDRRSSEWVLWGGLGGSVLLAGFLYVTLVQRSRDYEQTSRHLAALESLQAISSTIIAHMDASPDSLTELCESARRLLRADRAGIQLLDAKARRLEMLAHAGDMPADPPRYYDLDDMPNVRWCLENAQVLFAEDVAKLHGPQNAQIIAYFRARSMILIPLLVQGEQIGLMTLSSSAPARFSDADRRLAELLGVQAAVILANSRLYQAQQSAVQKYKALVDQRELLFSTNASIFQTGDLNESLRRVAELAPLALGVDVCVVALSADPPNNVRIAAFTAGAAARHLRPGATFFCPAAERAFQRGAICVFANAATEPDLALLREGFPDMGSVACVPLAGRDGARIGTLALVRRQAGTFSAEQLKMARLFSTRAAAAIENARLHQETRAALEEQKKLLVQRDSLWAVNAAVYRAGTLEQSLDRIVRLAPAALGVDLCGVDLATGREGEVYLAAITDDLGREMIGKPLDVRGRNAGRALERREPVVIENALEDGGILADFRSRFRIGSIAYFPLLRGDGEILGLLVLVRHRAGPFDKAQIELARVFATRAASAVENAQLFDQTRRDAETKAMLLRELNHRVKNNLAGIVALLSLGRPEMPPAAGRWLDRATDRVRVMAEAHQLFVGDAGSVALGKLVERMLSSLSVAWASASPGVEMRVEVGARAADVELRTEQAISLAMALHELCYNAIVHGLGGGPGTVTLRTRDAGPGRLAVDVIDTGRAARMIPGPPHADGNGDRHGTGDGDRNGDGDRHGDGDDVNGSGHWDADGQTIGRGGGNGNGSGVGAAVAGTHTGIGIELVRGLVGRELRGRFSLAPAPGGGGGSVATVEFPLEGATTNATPHDEQ